MADEAIPRLFQLRTGDQLTELRAHGVQWPNGAVTVRWIDPPFNTIRAEEWRDFDDPDAEIVKTVEVTVVWLRQDTYADQEV